MKKKLLICLSAISMLLASCGSNKQDNDVSALANQSQLDFEETYIKAEPTWNEAKTIINIVGALGMMFIGGYEASATAACTGIFSFMTNFGEIFALQSTPTIKDVIDKLNVMDAKLDRISDQIEANQEQLIDEIVATQAQIDKVLVNQYDENIVTYNHDYVEPLEDKIKIYEDYIEHNLGDMSKTTRDINLYYLTKDGKEEIQYISNKDIDISACNKYTYTLDFPQSRDFLKNHNYTVTEGFMLRFTNDIKNSIKGCEWPIGKSLNNMSDDIYSTMIDTLAYSRYIDPAKREDIVNYKNHVNNLATRLTGGLLTPSIIQSYVERLKVMYNFAGESKDILRAILVNLKYTLDRYTVQANTACQYAGINASDLGENYLKAIKMIRETYEAINALDDTYSYQLKTEVKGRFYNSKYDVSYANPGNHCTLHTTLKSKQVISYHNSNISTKDVDITKLNILNNADHLRMITRYNLLRGMGVVRSDSTYYDYLVDVGVINKDTADAYKGLVRDKWIGNECGRILTGYSVVDLKESDSNLDLTCVAKGNPGGSYFNVGWKGKYRNTANKRVADCWAGKMLSGTYIDYQTGAKLAEKRVCAWARYAESWTLWIDDEYYGFVDNTYGNYYFLLSTGLDK